MVESIAVQLKELTEEYLLGVKSFDCYLFCTSAKECLALIFDVVQRLTKADKGNFNV